MLSHVGYRSGAIADMAALTAATDADVVWDLSHSAGAIPVELAASGVELAVGCTYKYLNGGPGAPAYLYVATARQAELRSPIWGWFGQRDQFAMERDYDPVDGIGRFQAGTPPILALAAVEEGVKLTAEAGLPAIRAKSISLTELIVALHDAWLAPLGFSLGSPRDPEVRGSHVAVQHPDAWPICRALIERAHVVPDFRGPDAIRLGVAPALHEPRRRLGRARPPARPRRARRAQAHRRRAGASDLMHAVVIAGGGPTGLMLAGELALAGVDVAIVERRAGQELAGSRAGGLHARTIEVLDQRGIADRFLSEGQVAQAVGFAGGTLDLSDFPTRHPYTLGLWQNHIERILAGLGRRAAGDDPSRTRGDGVRAGRHRRRRRAVRRRVAAGGVSRRVRRRTQR